jgi:hypothetical protein
MSTRSSLPKLAVAVIVLICLPTDVCAQQQQQSAPQSTFALSEPVHTTLYPEIMCVGCVVPRWDGRHLLHQEIHKDPAVVTMYDANGNKVLTLRISAADSSNVWVLAAASTVEGGILVGAAGNMTDGTRKGFIARADRTGRTLQSVLTANFEPDRICETADGTVWTFGPSWDEDKNVLRHYSFEKGLLGTFVSPNSIPGPHAVLEIKSPRGSYLHCGEERVSVYLALSGQYFELDTSTNRVSSWKVDMSSVIGRDPRGFAITEDHRIFVALGNPNRMRGLYELRAVDGDPIASLTPIDSTIVARERLEDFPEGAFLSLFGADGDALVVQRVGDWPGLSWVKVVSTR